MGIAEIAVASGEAVLVAAGLGSCVAIALYDSESKVGALAHVLLPEWQEKGEGERLPAREKQGKSPFIAVPAMLGRMRDMGMQAQPTARIVGGASMFAELLSANTTPIGTRNVVASRLACLQSNVAVAAEAVGGTVGRSVHFELSTGRLDIRTVNGDATAI